jgi:hypothetical protein
LFVRSLLIGARNGNIAGLTLNIALSVADAINKPNTVRILKMRRLYLILGDQLDRDSLIFKDVDRDNDCFWMAEVAEEATHVWLYFYLQCAILLQSFASKDCPLHIST